MNKTMIALAVSAAALATNAVAADGKQAGGIDGTSVYSSNGTSLEIGGRAEARLSLKDGKAEDKTRVRLNFLGKVEIQDGLYGVGFYEGEFTTAENGGSTDNNDGDITNRYTYAGIGGDFGEVTYGKNDGALGVITDFTDIMSYHGNSAAMKIAVADRSDNMVSYKGQFQDLGVKASYRFADRQEGVVNGCNIGEYCDNDADGYSLSGIYAIGDSGFKLGAGYADQADQNEYMLAASFRTEALYFAGTFTDGELAKKDGDYTGYEFATAYTLDKTAFTLTYNNAETDGDTSADNVAIDATYYFKPNFRTYISYNFNLISEGDKFGNADGVNFGATKVQAEDELALGLRYDF
ncbi:MULTISPECIES: porin [Vibrio]|uniref:Porin domain-containing protein n=8 Tax=Vibrio TaxID=662 RepID=A0A7Z1MHM8_9VIBR|nr:MULTISPECIES: porin [Vibrio]KNH14715.1 membrane protein [Vibrio lentus]MBY7660919.1 porin [Vibrio atlanticus]ERM59960.1 Outer membrane protein OmpU [Vibrio cyclitrophicus FF75]KAA8600507.1 Outer membrane porin OmpU [Vibrio cyclitrophicus]MBE8556120.1 porin [Vibrio sp. OPT24]